jgi:hypothetical protein
MAEFVVGMFVNADDYVEAEHRIASLEARNAELTEAIRDADHLCKWLLQSDISASDRERVILENGINFAALSHDATSTASSHRYLSTACHHQQHERCRMRCKFCEVACVCACHLDNPGQHDATRLPLE